MMKCAITILTGLALWFSITAMTNAQIPQPVSPAEGHKTSNNAPLLSWSETPCQYYELWIDGIKADSVSGTLHSAVPFPLSFGRHTWYVVAVDGNKRIAGDQAGFVIDDAPLEKMPENALLLRHDWKIQSSLMTTQTGAELSASSVNNEGWYKSSVPVTVLSALVRNGIYPNPYHGMNNMRIPDSNDEYNKEYDLLKYSHIPGSNPWKNPYWFTTSFEIPTLFKGKMIWLNFSEINYRAEVWLNGKKIADTIQMAGMEIHFRYNVTSLVKSNAKNYLAVAVYPVDHPGKPAQEPVTPLGAPGDNMGDGIISKNYTKWDAIGWDWQPAIRDREMGITEDVFLSATGSAEITNLYVTSDLPLPDTSSAQVTISGDVVNYSNKTRIGVIKGSIIYESTVITVEEPFNIGAGQTFSFLWNQEKFSDLFLKNPHLWWPHGYGKPNLYTLRLEAIIPGEQPAKAEMRFGIREVGTYLGSNERVYTINGKEIYCKGGNWVIDMMLNWNARRYEDEILLTRNANLNMLRVWGPTGVPPKVFYEAADQYGIMIWQDFLYDFWGTFRNRPGYNTRDDLYKTATIGIVKEYRNHPALVIWCGGNEGPNPREELILKEILPQYDGRDSKHYLKISNGDGLHGGGPYHTLSPREYFSHDRLNGFSSEIGPSGVPVIESIRKFMPDLGRDYIKERFPINASWSYHDANDWAGNDSRKFSSYDNLIRQHYGAPASTDENGVIDYLAKTQLLNYDVYRSSIESINRQLWANSSGILLWKSNSSWPSMVWQVYDWYLQSHAGLYGTKNAAEPVHIQLNGDSLSVTVLNTQHHEIRDVKISASVYNSAGKIKWNRDGKYTLKPNSVYHTGWVVPAGDTIGFVRLSMKDDAGALISENTYFIQKQDDLKDLQNLHPAKISGKVVKTGGSGRTTYHLTLTNEGSVIACMIECRLQGSESGMELLPSLWDKNYITLLPHESKQLEVNINNEDLTETPVINCKAYNMTNGIILR